MEMQGYTSLLELAGDTRPPAEKPPAKKAQSGRRPACAGPRLIHVDPARIRPGPLNPRSRERLEALAGGTLASSLRQAGQAMPCLARPLKGDPDHDVELIAGARRHHEMLLRAQAGEDVKVAVVLLDPALDDVAAAKLADAENNGRASLSEYERACFVAKCLDAVFDGDTERLRKEFGLTPTRLSRLRNLAGWPIELVSAFGPHAITQQDVSALQGRLRGPKREALLTAAVAIGAEQKGRRAAGTPAIAAKDVRQRLLEAVTDEPAPTQLQDANGNVTVVVRARSKRGMLLYVPAGRAQQKALIEAVGDLVAGWRA